MVNGSSERDIREALDTLAQARPGFWSRTACGVTRSLTPIPALLDRNAYSAETGRIRVLLVGGLSGRAADVDLALHALELYAGGGDGLALRVGVSAIPCGNPDGLRLGRGPENGAGGNPSQGYPPVGQLLQRRTRTRKSATSGAGFASRPPTWCWPCAPAPAPSSGNATPPPAGSRPRWPPATSRTARYSVRTRRRPPRRAWRHPGTPADRIRRTTAPRDKPPVRGTPAARNVRQVRRPTVPRPPPPARPAGNRPHPRRRLRPLLRPHRLHPGRSHQRPPPTRPAKTRRAKIRPPKSRPC